MSDMPLLSVVCVTYNHAAYIAKTLDSFLAQKTSFPFEVVIGDDGSNDGTSDICRDYAKRHPGVIRHMLWDRAASLAYGIPSKYNCVHTLRSCRGRYASICDGDDYLLGTGTLQWQVDFLESHPDYGMVHGGIEVYIEEERRLIPYREGTVVPTGMVYDDLFIWNFIRTSSACVRMEEAQLFADLMEGDGRDFRAGDYCFWLGIAARWKVGYIDAPLAAYRVHQKSMTNMEGMSNELKFAREKYRIQRYFGRIHGSPVSDRERLLFYLRRGIQIASSHGSKELEARFTRELRKRLNRWFLSRYFFMTDSDMTWL